MTRKLFLSDASIQRVPFAKGAPYRIVDSDLPGLYLHVGKDWKTLRLKLEVDGHTRSGGSWRWPAFKADEAREAAEATRKRRDRGEPLDGPNDAITLLQAWESYEALMKKKQRSQATIDGYRNLVERCLRSLHHKPLREITRQDAIDLHTEISTKGAPRSADPAKRKDGTPVRRKSKPAKYVANGVMRVAHAIYNHAAKDLEKPLPALNPFRGRNLHNKEERRKVKFDQDDLPRWFDQLKALKNSIWREFYLMVMLTGLRRRTVESLRWEDVHFDHGYIDILKPKGGEDRAFRVPMSDAMRRSLERVRRAGEPFGSIPKCRPWVYPSPRSASGRVAEPKSQNIDTTPKDQRHIFILFATGAGVGETHRHVLTNHKIPRSVHNEYMNVPSMFGQLVDAQESVSTYILKHIGKGLDRTLDALLKRDLTPKAEAA